MKEEMKYFIEERKEKYVISYSQKLQERQIIIMRLLLVGLIILICLLLFAGVYGYSLITRIDALDPIARMGCL